jgi:long-chain acyl-CoA synthetase
VPLLVDPIMSWARSSPARAAVADRNRSLSYAEFAREIDAYAAGLSDSGVGPGERVILIGANCVDYLVAHFGILRAGAVSVPLSITTPADRIRFVRDDCGARLICTTSANWSHDALVAVRVDELVRNERGRCVETQRVESDIACLMYTTGSTGRPKAVVLTHATIGSALAHITEYLGYSGEEREAIVLPLSHSFGLGHAYCTLRAGGFVWVHEGLRPPKLVLQALTQQQITAMPASPAMLRLLMSSYRKMFLEHAVGLKQMVVNSEPLPADLAEDLLESLPHLDLVTYYGLTEASRSAFVRPRQEPTARRTVAGKAANKVELGIFGSDDRQLPAGEDGEVRIRGPHLATGYWNRPDEQAAAFRQGWLCTGDIGRLDQDGYLTITGRIKDQINVGGLKVAAGEVERVLRLHPLVADAAVTGIVDPQRRSGEAVGALIVARDGMTEEDLVRHCSDELEPHMLPTVVRFVSAIPRAQTGKILKGDVRQMLEQIDGTSPA